MISLQWHYIQNFYFSPRKEVVSQCNTACASLRVRRGGPEGPQRHRSPGEGAEPSAPTVSVSAAFSLCRLPPPLRRHKRGGPGSPARLRPRPARSPRLPEARPGPARPAVAAAPAARLHGFHPQAAAGAGAVLQGEVSGTAPPAPAAPARPWPLGGPGGAAGGAASGEAAAQGGEPGRCAALAVVTVDVRWLMGPLS